MYNDSFISVPVVSDPAGPAGPNTNVAEGAEYTCSIVSGTDGYHHSFWECQNLMYANRLFDLTIIIL